MKRLIGIASFLLALVLVLGACAPAAAPTATPTPPPAKATAAPAAATAVPKEAPKPAATSPGAAATAPAKVAATPAASAPAKANALDQLYEAARKEGQVVWHTGTAPEYFKQLTQAFQKRFPGIDLQILGGSAPTMAERLMTEAQAKRITVDLATLGVQHALPMMDRNVILTPEAGALGVDPKNLVADGKMLFMHDVVSVHFYNTKIVAEKDVPTKWEDLTDPKWTGKIALLRSGGGGWERLVESKTMTEAQFLSYLQQIAKLKPIAALNQEQVVTLVASGEAAIGDTLIEGVAIKWKEGAPLGLLPFSPMHSLPVYAVVLNGSPHPNAAKLLWAWLDSPDIRKIMEQEAEWDTLNPCGPSRANQMMCGKKFDIARTDTVEKAKETVRLRPLVIKALGFDTQ